MKKRILCISLLISISLQAQYTYVPDNNFEQALIDLGYDDVLDDYVLTENINTVTTLEIQSKNIDDLTGIEDFIALEILKCDNNNISILDLSSNINLIHLECQNNQLTNLDINNCNLISYLDFSINNITSINISTNLVLKVIKGYSNNLNEINILNHIDLETLIVSWNQLNEIDISNNLNLVTFKVVGNNLTEIDISNNINLLYLNISYNQISSLDTSSNTALDALTCHHNQITELNLTNNPLHALYCQNNNLNLLDIRNGYNNYMQDMYATENPELTCVFVDTINFTNPSFWHISSNTTFVTSETTCESLALKENNLSKITVYPNPIKNSFIINDLTINKVMVYNIQGVKVATFNQQQYYAINELPNGIYFLKIIKNNQYTFMKVIKN